MLMEQFDKWKAEHSTKYSEFTGEDLFSVFYQEQMFGKTFFEMIYEVAYQVYELQICMDGVLEDLDGQENQKA